MILLRVGSIHSIHIYDLFCGKGETDEGQTGSALIGVQHVLSSVTELATNKNIYLHLSDNNQQYCNELENRIGQMQKPENVIIDVKCVDFKDAAQEAIAKHKSSHSTRYERVLYFIDPYGYKDTDPQTLLEIKQNCNSEIFLFLPVIFIYRFISGEKANRSIGLWRSFIDYHGDSSDLRSIVWGITKRFSAEGFHAGYFILTNQICGNEYAIFFVSSNLRGLEKFNEVKWDNDRVSGSQMGRDYTFSMASCIEDDLHMIVIEELKRNILCHIASIKDRRINNGQLYSFIVHEGFLPKHFTEIWNIDKFLKRAFTTRRNRGNYISYEHFNEEPLVWFSLKESDVDI
jgi:three-Cys-motif partner protein